MCYCHFGFIMLLTLMRGCLAVRFDYLGVPGSVLRGDSVWLDCGYDLQEDELYSVKWYKDNYEFYRYLPSDQPPSQALNLKGVYLDIRRSNATHVYLKATDLETEGTYACEVSTDAPSFRTVRAEKELRVYVMPDSDPVIEGVMRKYPIGDEINVTCFYGPSKPPATLKWYINGRNAPRSYVTDHVLHKHEEEVMSAESRLRFVVDPSHLWQGFLSIQCTASLSQVFSKSSEELIVGDGTSGIEFQRLAQVAPGQEGPTISGGKSTYDAGDIVDVNCTSARSIYPAEISWYINDEEAKPEFLVRHKTISYADGRASSRMGLRFLVKADHFISEEIRLKCTSTLSKVIELSSVKTVFGGNQQSSELYHVSPDTASGYKWNRMTLCGLISIHCFVHLIWR